MNMFTAKELMQVQGVIFKVKEVIHEDDGVMLVESNTGFSLLCLTVGNLQVGDNVVLVDFTEEDDISKIHPLHAPLYKIVSANSINNSLT